MTDRVAREGLHYDRALYDFITGEALVGSNVGEDDFFRGFAAIVKDLQPRNRALLETRDAMQKKLDDWYREHGAPTDLAAYKQFLREIDYLLPEGDDFSVETANVDPEIAEVAGPQLVVPVDNARYALNAANARWGSLYDAVYGTDVLGDRPEGGGYDPERGKRVIAWSKDLLDTHFPLAGGSWSDVTGLTVDGGKLSAAT